jgi:hypothetical protein
MVLQNSHKPSLPTMAAPMMLERCTCIGMEKQQCGYAMTGYHLLSLSTPHNPMCLACQAAYSPGKPQFCPTPML